MTIKGFEVGERFRVRPNLAFVLAGTAGTILQKYISVVDTYKVQLDGQTYARVMPGSDLVYLAFEFGERIKARTDFTKSIPQSDRTKKTTKA